jgi:hypothetical protein
MRGGWFEGNLVDYFLFVDFECFSCVIEISAIFRSTELNLCTSESLYLLELLSQLCIHYFWINHSLYLVSIIQSAFQHFLYCLVSNYSRSHLVTFLQTCSFLSLIFIRFSLILSFYLLKFTKLSKLSFEGRQ